MIPVGDEPRSRAFPFVNLTLIVVNVLVFFYELTLRPRDLQALFFDWGVVPVRLVDWLQSPSGWEVPATVFTSMFLHGGWLHLIGNLLYLWVFGDNVEDALGHVKYLLFYLASGIGAVALQVAIDVDGTIPMVGASGAISGVLGAYLVLYPTATVAVLVPWFWFFGFMPMPAAVLIGFWFLLQLFSGVASLGAQAVGVETGIAFWAHIGGFITGFLLVLLLRPRRRSPVLQRWDFWD
ncbi:MAG: rhomboid family intramembrane serine protease [Dehalococcoidia bacterium]|nr:rhomboid family intramembrane serine protease [Dehalococcoidia bacterium]MDW8009286.1 rhomboid family intramembrane serine protease [Chloroflexota bacterium]